MIEKDLDEFRPDSHWDDDTIIEYYKKKTREICGILEEDERRRKKELLLNNKNFFIRNAKEARNKKKVRPGSSFRVSLSNHSSKIDRLSSPINRMESANTQKVEKIEETESVLNMLFPYVNENDFKIEPFKSGADLRNENRIKRENIPIIKMNQERRIKSNFIKKYKKYDKDLNTYADNPTIRRSSEYLTLEQIKRREFIKSKKLWVSSFDFKRYFNKYGFSHSDIKKKEKIKKEKYTPDKYIEPTRLCCREIDKNKWISKRNFVV
jgi:hypothetical protein